MGGQQREDAQGRREAAGREVARRRGWRRAFLATLIAAYGLGLFCAFVFVPATDIPWIHEAWWGSRPPGLWPDLLGTAWWVARDLRGILPWLAYPLVLWGLAGALGALDRWVKPLTGVHVLLLLLVLALGASAGLGYAGARAAGGFIQAPLRTRAAQ